MDLSTFLIEILNGLQYGMLLFLIASGLTLTFGVMGIINLAHGAFFMVGAYLAFQFSRHWGWPLPAAYVAAVAAVVVLGALVERSVLAPLANRDHLDQVLVTYGLILIFDELAVIGWGKDVLPAAVPSLLRGSVHIAGAFSYPLYRLALLRGAALRRRALSSGVEDAARHVIVPRGLGRPYHGARARHQCRRQSLAWCSASARHSPPWPACWRRRSLSVSPGMGDKIIIIAFVVVVIGGIGSIKGAFVWRAVWSGSSIVRQRSCFRA